MSSSGVDRIVKAIASANNQYRLRDQEPVKRLVALWEIGDVLHRMKVRNPHALGWEIQKATRGLIKRPTIFRGHKIRTIWPSKQLLSADLRSIKGLSVLTEMLPLIDPSQPVHKKLTQEHFTTIFRHANSDSPQAFKVYIAQLKTKFSRGRLGARLDRSRHLKALDQTVDAYRRLLVALADCMTIERLERREGIRRTVPENECAALANMSLSLTTKENRRLYRALGPGTSAATLDDFREVYGEFRRLLEQEADVERARLRRLISAESLAQMSDILSSIGSEDGVRDFTRRRDLALHL